MKTGWIKAKKYTSKDTVALTQHTWHVMYHRTKERKQEEKLNMPWFHWLFKKSILIEWFWFSAHQYCHQNIILFAQNYT